LTDRWLPPGYIAEEYAYLGPSVEIDVATFTREPPTTAGTETAVVATLGSKVWSPPAADASFPAVFPDTFEVRVLATDTGPRLVAAIELVSPSNKDRPNERKAFATKVASYLYQGVSVIVVDIVTNRRANLHNEVVNIMDAGDSLRFLPESTLYTAAYRPLRRGHGDEIDLWRSTLELGRTLPTLPLGLRADLAIPVDFEATYAEACLRKRLTGS